MDYKKCCGCEETKPISDFYRSRKKKSEISTYCKECYSKRYNDPKVKEYYRNYVNERNYRLGIRKPMNKNKRCSSYLGIHIAENVLSKIFKYVKRMPNNNPGFDFICNKGYKIDVKSSCLNYPKNKSPCWHFTLKRNNIPDYFLLLAFDNRNDLNPLHVWLVPNKILNKLFSTSIANLDSSLSKWLKYELNDKLEKVIACCNVMKSEA